MVHFAALPEVAGEIRPTTVLQGPRLGWLRAALPGVALVAVSLMLALLFGLLDTAHYSGLKQFFTPDPVAAAGTLGLVGGAEGVTISIVIVAVVFGIQMTSSRYSPRIIGLFTRNL